MNIHINDTVVSVDLNLPSPSLTRGCSLNTDHGLTSSLQYPCRKK